tara:strand:+ start:74 stop:319 length:246 start_codon:yes stop_codon:yes gene_type:complete
VGKLLLSIKIFKIVRQVKPKEAQSRMEPSSMNVKENFALFVSELTTRITSTILLGTRTGTAIIAPAIVSALAAKGRTLPPS